MLPEIKSIVEGICFQPVGPDQSLMRTGLIDSIGVVDLIVALNEQFGVNIDMADVSPETFDTLEQIAALVAARKHAN